MFWPCGDQNIDLPQRGDAISSDLYRSLAFTVDLDVKDYIKSAPFDGGSVTVRGW
jgi:hypothetical protein